MLLSLKLIVGNEDWHLGEYPNDRYETIYSNISLEGYTNEIKVYIHSWNIYDKVIYKKYDLMRWPKKTQLGKIIYNLKEEIFKQEMRDIISGSDEPMKDIINCED